MESFHAEGESPFVVKEDDEAHEAIITPELDREEDHVKYASCPVKGCGENILLTELDNHIDMHASEDQPADDDGLSIDLQRSETPKSNVPFDEKPPHVNKDLREQKPPDAHPTDPQAYAKAKWKKILKMPERSGKSIPMTKERKSRKRLGVGNLNRFLFFTYLKMMLTKTRKRN